MATTSSKDVFPRRNLPGEAEQWGRNVENRIEAGEDSETQLSQVVNNMGRATAGQLAVLSRQIGVLTTQQADLVGRVAYFSNDGTGSYSAPGDHVITGNSITITLDEPRVVQVDQSASASAFSPSTSASGFFLLQVNSSVIQRGSRLGSTVISAVSPNFVSVPISSSALISLPAGAHTITPVLSTQGSGTITLQESFITVNVLQVVS